MFCGRITMRMCVPVRLALVVGVSLGVAGGVGERKDVVEALILIGPEAEDEVLPYLGSKNKDAVKHAVEILGRAGTRKSLEPLNKTMKDFEKKDKDVVAGAKSAVAKIEER